MPGISNKTVGRLSVYRRILSQLSKDGQSHVYSHLLGQRAGMTAAQVRRDLMVAGCTGTPAKGYAINELLAQLDRFFGADQIQRLALAGVGNLGRALLAYFPARRPNAKILAAFDRDEYKTERVILGCRCYPVQRMEELTAELGISVGIIAVPAAEAQGVADQFVAGGVKGLLNFAPAVLRLPPDIYVEDIDITMMLDKVAYFARRPGPVQEVSRA